MGFGWDCIPADIFQNILQRLPLTIPRRRLRLVCRHWRNVIDDCTLHPQAHAKVLAFVTGKERSHAYVFDNLTEERAGGRYLELRGGVGNQGSSMVGTCNGLLCLRRRDGDVVIVNPATGEKLAVPPPPSRMFNVLPKDTTAAYSFGYHPETGLYKVVHVVPCAAGDGVTFDTVDVFTLGDASWRVVPVRRGSSFLPSFGVVSANGATYWVAEDAHSLMSFDLKDERLKFVTTLPVRVGPSSLDLILSWHLTTDLRGRLGYVVCSHDMKRARTLKGTKTEVWVLEDGGRDKKRSWVLLHTIAEPGSRAPQGIAWPHFIHGENVLTTQGDGESWASLHAYSLNLSEPRMNRRGVVHQMESTPPPLICLYCSSLQTFAYVETTEPLALYGCDDGSKVVDCEEWIWYYRRSRGRWELIRNCSSLMDLCVES
ncbi:unnamed protein product [Urochloa decumbens]|uniref:F-box domain-containing protein n=1 Tax=Urochloa decumbens TaxID=240449 RepID=A0ABC9BQJ3_9POAL